MKYKPNRDIPKLAFEYHTLSPSKLAELVLSQRNKQVTPESVTMWFKRHPQIYEDLKRGIIKEELPELEVQETIFQNGTFEELPSVATWIKEMQRRKIVNWKIQVTRLKCCCLGKFRNWKVDLVAEGKMAFKHPDRYTLEDALQIIDLLEAKGIDTHSVRMPLRNFLMSKGINVEMKISGAKGSGYGKFSDLYVPKDPLNQILEDVRALNFEAHTVDLFMYKTGTRIEATLNALIEKITKEGDYREITIYDKARRRIYPEGKPWKKYIPPDLWEALKVLIGDRTEGKIFNITEQEMANINRTAFQKVIPDLNKKIPMPNHFWRHMFFQHMLRATNWNYGAVAQLGGSTVMSLEESYGKPPRAIIRQWGIDYIPQI